MKNPFYRFATAALMALLLAFPVLAQAAYSPNPDLTADGAIAALKVDPNASHSYAETYNLGATGLRGWIYMDTNNPDSPTHGLITALSRQILVTVASTPGSAVLAVDDVILGAMAGSSGAVPLFTSDCRKAFGVAIGEAEKTGAGTLRVKRWRGPFPGTTTDVNIPMTIMGDYTATAPYSCPKSALILANARIKLVSQLLADPNFLTNNYGGAIKGLALLAVVAPGDANYATVQTRLQTFARSLAAVNLQPTGMFTWNWGYMGLFLSEYYLRTVADGTPDASVLAGINNYTVELAKVQGRYGTFGHGGSVLTANGGLHGTIPPYGPVNAAGIPANIAIVMGKKALVAGSQAIDPEIDPAIQRASDFFAFYVNKGSIPYGEHEPISGSHCSNGKDPMCAVLFGLQAGRTVETEFFTRMSTSGYIGREGGHTGQGFSYLWGAMGANMGGPTAITKYMENIRWHLDMERRTDGSFTYGGKEQFGGGQTADGTYLGATGYHDVSPTASYILSYGVSLQRLYITGRNAIPANTLSAAKVTNAIAAASFKQDCNAYTTAQLIAALSEYDPVVRNDAAVELGTRTLTTPEVDTLLAMAVGADANGRMGACQTLGILKTPGALTLLGQRLSDSDVWVRAQAAKALRNYGSVASAQLTPMLTAFTANASDPEVIVWNDPIQISNNYLSFTLFGDSVLGGNNIASHTINASKSLLYPAMKAGLKQPDSYSRSGAASFSNSSLTFADVVALTPDIFEVTTTTTQADTMWSMWPRVSGISTLAKHKAREGIPMALAMQVIPTGFDWGSDNIRIGGLNALKTYGDSARWTLPALRQYQAEWSAGTTRYTTLTSAINTIEAAITSPAGMVNLEAVATQQVVATAGAVAITLTGTSPRDASVTFLNVTQPLHGTVTGTAPNLTYTPTGGYTGPDHFTFQVEDSLTTSTPGTVSVIVGTAGTGLKGEYFNNTNFTSLQVTRVDPQVDFDWGTGSPDPAIGADTFSVRWSGLLLVPETGAYTFSTLSDGVRLYVNGVAFIDDFADQTASWKDSVSINLTEGQLVDLQMEYVENTGSALAKLKWTGPSFAGLNGVIIAQPWLFEGAGYRPPFAHAQNVALAQNTAQPITLTGSGTNLTYSLLSQPTNGTLTGTAPLLTYTPAVGFFGTDSFIFLVNDGTTNSAPALVSITVGGSADSPVSLFWTNGVSGDWSGAFWTDAAAVPITPAASGQSYYSLNFNRSGKYTVTHDLNNGFTFNKLNVSGEVTFDGANSLSPMANGTLQPQINQDSVKSVTFNMPLVLTTMTTLGGSGGGDVSIPNLISGAGGLNHESPGNTDITQVTNTYSGGTVISDGTITLGLQTHQALGTGPITINPAGTLAVNRCNPVNPLTLNGGKIAGYNGFGNTFSGPVTLNATSTMDVPDSLTISGPISGAGGLTKTGANTLTLSGTNSYTGKTTVQTGTLRCNTTASLGTGPLDITDGAKVRLNVSGTRVVSALTYNGGAPLPAGTYGSVASPATNKSDYYFTSTYLGTVTVLPTPTVALALTTGSTPSQLGTTLTFTATVTGSTPTGNVAFYAGTTLLGTTALNGAFQAALTTSSLAVGSYNITAQYAGNASNAAATSSALAIQVTSVFAPPPINVFAASGNTSVALTWTVSASATGYRVKRSLTNGGPYTLVGSPTAANYSDASLTNGVTYFYVVTAINGAGESANSAQVSATPAIPASNTVVTSSVGYTGVYGDAVIFTATVAVPSGTAAGTVTFMDGATVLGTGVLDGSGLATFTGTLAVGSHAITASYGGSGSFSASVSPVFTFTVAPKSVTITGVTASNKIYDGTTAATLTGGTLVGVLGGETVTIVAGSGTFSSANVGTRTVTASAYTLGGAHAGNYMVSPQPTVPSANITARLVQLGGTRAYDGTTVVAAADLTVSNLVAGDALTLSGSANITGKDVGPQSIPLAYATPVRVQSATGFSAASTSTSFTATMTAAPTNGNTLIAVISTRGSVANQITAIASTGAVWTRAGQSVSVGSTTEIWSAPVGASAGTTVTFTTLTGRCSGVVIEYSGLLPTADQTASASGTGTAATTGTTAATTQASELWIGGIGFPNSTPTLGTILNSFTTVASVVTTSTTAANNVKTYALESIVSAIGTASSGGTLSTSVAWSGEVAAFKAGTTSGLTLTGTDATNYTLTGATGTVQITARLVQLGGTRAYNGTTTVAAADLTVSNLIAGDNLILSGSATVSGKDVGAQPIPFSYATPVRVQSATGFSAASTSTSFTATMTAAPTNGNTLIAVISTRGSAVNQITAIASTGAVWTRAGQSVGTGTTTEIWSAPVSASAGTTVTFTTLTGRCSGVVMEYSGLLPTADQTASASNTGTAADTGTTAATTQASELWIGGIGFPHSTPTLGSILNSFTTVASAVTTSTTAANNVKTYALESIVSAIGTANSGGTISASVAWSGEMATFKTALSNAPTTALTLTGADAANYTITSATGTVQITARPLQLGGTRAYNGTTAVAAADLTVTNLVAGDALTLGGSTNLVGKDVGPQSIPLTYVTPVRVQSATGFSAASTSTSFTATMTAAPTNGNTLIAVISTRGSAVNQITAIASTGAVWTRAGQSVSTGTTTEIWSAPVGASAGTTVTFTTLTGRCSGVVIEYGGLLPTADQTASASNTGTAADTGTTAATTQASELWIGGIGFPNSTPTLDSILNSFTTVASVVTTSTTAANNVKTYALESLVTAIGTASSGGTLSASVAWSGQIATFKTGPLTTLTLTGPDATNYTLNAATGTVQITAAPLTITANAQAKPYGQTLTFGSGSTQFTSTSLQAGETIGSVTLTSTGGISSAAAGTYAITPSAPIGGTFTATNYTLQFTNGTLTVTNPYETWATAQGLTAGNNAPLDDPDRDGIRNLIEFALNSAPMTNGQTNLPTLTKSGGNWLFEYNRSDLSQPATTQTVEYTTDLITWTQVPIPATSAGIVTITPGSPTDHVTVTIPNAGVKTFFRLKVVQ